MSTRSEDPDRRRDPHASVDRALVTELKALRRQTIYQSYAQAAADPAFRAEAEELTDAWDVVVGDGLVSP